jgi:hypothetical protein
MGSKGYFNPRMKLKDFNRKKNEFIRKPDSKRVYQKFNGKQTWFKKSA